MSNMLSRNVGNLLPTYSAQYPTRVMSRNVDNQIQPMPRNIPHD